MLCNGYRCEAMAKTIQSVGKCPPTVGIKIMTVRFGVVQEGRKFVKIIRHSDVGLGGAYGGDGT